MKLKESIAEHRRLWFGLASVLFVLAAWEALLTYVFPLNPFFFTKPSLIAVAFKEQVIYGALWGDLAVSSKAFLWGFSFAILLGIPLGALMGWRRKAGYTLDPFFTALYASPLVALAPLIIVVFGVGLFAKSVLVFALSVFPFIFNTFAVAVIQRSCTTAIEAALAGVPGLSPQWIPAPSVNPMAEAVSEPCESYAELESHLRSILSGSYRRSAAVSSQLESVVRDWFCSSDGRAYERVGEAIAPCLGQGRIVGHHQDGLLAGYLLLKRPLIIMVLDQ